MFASFRDLSLRLNVFAFAQIEAELKTCPLVENICIHGDASTGRLVAITAVNQSELLGVARRLGKCLSPIELCADPDVRSEVRDIMGQHAMAKVSSQWPFSENPIGRKAGGSGVISFVRNCYVKAGRTP